MFASAIASCVLLAAPPQTSWPPQTTLAELDAMEYSQVRQKKIAHVLETTGTVRLIGLQSERTPMLTLSKNWSGFLHNVPKDHHLKPGDRVRFKALILDEAFSGLQLWAYSWKKVNMPGTKPTRQRPTAEN